MDTLRELVYVVTKNKVKRIELLDLSDASSGKVNALYQAISRGDVTNDDEAAWLLYADEPSSGAYYGVKRQLEDKLLNTLFFIDSRAKTSTDRQAVFHDLHKDYAAAQLLLARQARGAAIALLENIRKQARKYEFTELSVLVLRTLRLHYSTQPGETRKYKSADKELAQCQAHLAIEDKAEQRYAHLVMRYMNHPSKIRALQQMAQKYYQELAAHKASVPTYKYHFFAGMIHLFQYTCLNDYRGALPVATELLAFFKKKPYRANTALQLCLHHQLVACLQLRDYKSGAAVAEESQALQEAGSYNWYKNQEYHFLLAMHTGNYQDAYRVFSEAAGHNRFAFLPDQSAEMWQVYQAYLCFLMGLGRIEVAKGDVHFTTFRLNRFLNSIPLYAKDKRGMNIAILVVQVLLNIQKGKYDAAVDSIEAIEKYCSRYLFQADTLRSYYFIKQLLEIPKAGFHKVSTERYSAEAFERLQQIPLEFSSQVHKVEILPYEQLWALSLETLSDKKVARKVK